MTAITTPRLHLSPMMGHDLDLYVAIYTDAMVMAHVEAPLTVSQARASFAVALQDRGDLRGGASWWILRSPHGGAALGLVGLRRDGTSAELGVLLLPGAQRRGVAREAMSALVDAAVHADDMHTGCLQTVLIRHAPANAAMAAVAGALGFARASPGPAGAGGLDAANAVHWVLRLRGRFASGAPPV